MPFAIDSETGLQPPVSSQACLNGGLDQVLLAPANLNACILVVQQLVDKANRSLIENRRLLSTLENKVGLKEGGDEEINNAFTTAMQEWKAGLVAAGTIFEHA